MPINHIILYLIFGLLSGSQLAGCSAGRLAAKVDIMEKDIASLQQANQRLNARLDDLQIQLSLLARKMAMLPEGSNQPGGLSLPELKVVRLHPNAPALEDPRKASPQGQEAASNRRSVPSIDPRKVHERLPVDHQAAQRTLLDSGSSTLAGDDEETISREFEEACAYYRALDYKRAMVSLQRFQEHHPGHHLAQDAWYLAARAALALGNVESAQQAFLALAQQHPNNQNAARALLMAGNCDEKLGHLKQARSTYLQLVQAYPLSEEAAEANRRLQAIQ